MKSPLVLLFLAAATAASAAPGKSQKAQLEALGKRIEKAVHALKSVSYSVTGTIEIKGPGGAVSVPVTSSVQIKFPNRFKIENTADFGGTEHKNILMSNGRTVWELNSNANTYTEQPLSEISRNGRLLGRWFTEHGIADMSLAVYLEGLAPSSGKKTPGTMESMSFTKKVVDGRDTYIVQMSGPMAGSGSGRVALYLDAKDLLPRRSRLTLSMREGNTPVTITIALSYAEIDSNVDMLDDAFRFDPPEGVRQVSKMVPFMRQALSGSE